MFVEKDNPKKGTPAGGRYEILIDACPTQVGNAEEWNPKELGFII